MPQVIQERAFEFACTIVTLHTDLVKRGGVGRSLSRQLLRSGTSIGANLVEASAGQSKADFISKCSIASKEAREAHYWLRLIHAANVLPPARLEALIDEANQIASILTTIVRNAQMSSMRGDLEP